MDGGTTVADASQPIRGDAGVDDTPTGDPCCAANGLEFQNIVNFETPLGRCDPIVDPALPQQTGCLYFNYDRDIDPVPDPNSPPPDSQLVLHSPPDCALAGLDVPGICRLPNGSIAPVGVCSTSNLVQATLPTSPIEAGGRCGTSGRALHLVAKNLSICVSDITGRQGYGATLFVTFNVNLGAGISAAGYDASAWEGVSLWVRKGSGEGGNSFLALARDPYTAPVLNSPDAAPTLCNSQPQSYCGSPSFPCISPEGGIFVTPGGKLMPAIPDSERCDPFGARVPATGDWRFVKLPFAQLKQGGAGKPSPLGGVDVTALVGLEFLFSPGDWDLWIDDIAFYRSAPEAVTCVDGSRIDPIPDSSDAAADVETEPDAVSAQDGG